MRCGIFAEEPRRAEQRRRRRGGRRNAAPARETEKSRARRTGGGVRRVAPNRLPKGRGDRRACAERAEPRPPARRAASPRAAAYPCEAGAVAADHLCALPIRQGAATRGRRSYPRATRQQRARGNPARRRPNFRRTTCCSEKTSARSSLCPTGSERGGPRTPCALDKARNPSAPAETEAIAEASRTPS